MKLLTHNFLQCHVKGVKNGYPLKIEAAKIEQRDADYDPGDCGGQHACTSLPVCLRSLRRRADAQLIFLHTSITADFLRTMYKRIDWKAFLEGAQAVRAAAAEQQASSCRRVMSRAVAVRGDRLALCSRRERLQQWSWCAASATGYMEHDSDSRPPLVLSSPKRVQLGCGDGLPAEVTEELLGDDGFMQKFHHALLEVRGSVCLWCGWGGVGPRVRRGVPRLSFQDMTAGCSNQQQHLHESTCDVSTAASGSHYIQAFVSHHDRVGVCAVVCCVCVCCRCACRRVP